jgi:hypothetical protein
MEKINGAGDRFFIPPVEKVSPTAKPDEQPSDSEKAWENAREAAQHSKSSEQDEQLKKLKQDLEMALKQYEDLAAFSVRNPEINVDDGLKRLEEKIELLKQQIGKE